MGRRQDKFDVDVEVAMRRGAALIQWLEEEIERIERDERYQAGDTPVQVNAPLALMVRHGLVERHRALRQVQELLGVK